ncbi:MAG: deoxyguanosinetriphosphate triphosphohydrolase [Actinomycetota bacterium]
MDKVNTATIRERIEALEAAALRPEATRAAASRGRERPEDPHPFRTAFQRDRDRILHSKAFRRLAHKTQVFLAPEGDHYRMRLTHTLEVVQVARTIARALQLNEDLVEAICLGHDVGHTPFGHLGEEVLTEFLGRPFRHSEQSLRILDALETRAGERGLNLTWEVRDGILNHTWSMPQPGTLEARVARYADRIAYINHDIDDAIRGGVLSEDDLPAETRRLLGETSSARVDAMVGAMVGASEGADDILMAPDVFEVLMATRVFLFERVYKRPEVVPEQERTRVLLRTVCDHYRRHPDQLPALGDPDDDPETRLVDYVAGMTDRFAKREYERITGERP